MEKIGKEEQLCVKFEEAEEKGYYEYHVNFSLL